MESGDLDSQVGPPLVSDGLDGQAGPRKQHHGDGELDRDQAVEERDATGAGTHPTRTQTRTEASPPESDDRRQGGEPDRDHGEEGPEADHTRIQPHVLEIRAEIAHRTQRREQAHRVRRKEEAPREAERGEDRGFRKEAPNEIAPSCTERDLDVNLPLFGMKTCENHARDVDGSDREDEGCRPEESDDLGRYTLQDLLFQSAEGERRERVGIRTLFAENARELGQPLRE